MNNLEKVGNIIGKQMQKTAGAFVPTTVELGKINSNMSLSTDTLGPIPKGQYMVDIRLAASSYQTSSESTGYGGTHRHNLPGEFRALRAGDRVMVVWCGNEPVVTAIVKSS